MHYSENNYLCHHGVKGQKWGFRRYQNADGSLTAAGRKRQAVKDFKRSADRQSVKAARTYYKKRRVDNKSTRTDDFKKYRKSVRKSDKLAKKLDRQVAGLTNQELKAGRYKVSSFRTKAHTIAGISSTTVGIGLALLTTAPAAAGVAATVGVAGGIAGATKAVRYGRDSRVYKSYATRKAKRIR